MRTTTATHMDPRRKRRAMIAVAIAALLLAGLSVVIALAIRGAKRIGDEKAREVEPYLQHVSFASELRNAERFAGPFYIVDPTGHLLASDVGDMPFSVRDAQTLAVCRTSRASIGEYHYMKSGQRYNLSAYRISAEICLIDLKDPRRRRVVLAVSEPPKVIQSESEYNEQAIHRFDDQPQPDRGKHDQYVLIAKAVKHVTR
jgi:hypothetical protein